MTKNLILIVAMAIVANAHAQADSNTELTVGDVLNNIEMPGVIRHTKNTINSNDYKGKIIILDFWATWCTPCVASIPKLDSIQQKYSSRLQVLPVTYQDSAAVQLLFAKRKHLKDISLPFVTGDNRLRFLFPHATIPHYVWINEEGKVVAITGIDELNDGNINKVINHIPVSFRIKKELNLRYEEDKGFLFQELGFEESNVVFQSLLTKYKDGLGSKRVLTHYKNASSKWRPQKISFSNLYPAHFFQFAWGNATKGIFDFKRTVVESADSVKIRGPKGNQYEDSLKQNGFCYELIFPDRDFIDVFEIMRSDLLRYFPKYAIQVEKRKTRCLVLERTSIIDKLKTKGGKFFYDDQQGMVYNNGSMVSFMGRLSYFLQNEPLAVVDGTMYKENVDIKLTDTNLSNIESLNQALKAYDLQIVEKDYLLDVLVIKDR